LKSHTTERFRKAFKMLPERVRRQAREAYKLFEQNPYHPSLHFKPIHPTRPIYSVRISRDCPLWELAMAMRSSGSGLVLMQITIS
jgi:hypothetical protein